MKIEELSEKKGVKVHEKSKGLLSYASINY